MEKHLKSNVIKDWIKVLKQNSCYEFKVINWIIFSLLRTKLSFFGSVYGFGLCFLLHLIQSRSLRQNSFEASYRNPRHRKPRSYDPWYQSHYIDVPRHKNYEWKYKQGNMFHFREGYLSQNDHSFKAKVSKETVIL